MLLALALVVIMLTSLTSCKKDWACYCSNQEGNITTSEIRDETFAQASNNCIRMGYSSGPDSQRCALH